MKPNHLKSTRTARRYVGFVALSLLVARTAVDVATMTVDGAHPWVDVIHAMTDDLPTTVFSAGPENDAIELDVDLTRISLSGSLSANGSGETAFTHPH